MKLEKVDNGATQDGLCVRDLLELLEQSERTDLRPCAGCDQLCPCSASAVCACACGPDCTHARIAMSSDGNRYPIEEKIAPLVFGFNCLRVCRPYWSCEGHQHGAERISKVPQVWFYASSLMYPKLIAEYLARLQTRKAIYNSWQVCVTYAEENLQAGFSIRPDMVFIGDETGLESMQRDVQIIAESLVAGVRAIASEYVRRYESDNARNVSETR
ncbi:MAG: hypothetical protein IIB77_01240 [Proteobacteria bacterium]|nr:hypothetical protein [Pseudomonadota bacterium]